MDLSECYINMCRKATEIQENWYPQLWDYVKTEISRTPDTLHGLCFPIKNKEKFVWLPRQDQLQKMVNHGQLFDFIQKFYWFVEDIVDTDEWFKFNPISMEILWLCFTMKERFNKIWTGEEWKEAN